VPGIVVGVQGQIDVDPSSRETTPVRGLTCFRKRATVALGETVRYPPLVMTSLAPAASSIGTGARRGSRAFLRPQLGHCGGRYVMPHDGRAQQIEADDVIAQIRAKRGGDRFGDLDGRKLDRTLSERVAGQRRNGDAAGLPAVEKRLDLPVPFHAIGKTGPTGTLARAEHRPTRGKMPEG